MHNVAFHLFIQYITSHFRTGLKRKKYSFQPAIDYVTDIKKSMLKII